jgi:radical SAM protein (TIGR01212 family)
MLPYYYSYNEYMTERFGEKVYKLSLDAGLTCPNRDGTKGTGGCIFCSAGGSGDFSERHIDDISLQIERAKKQVGKKYSGDKFVAYFQSYTNTYGDIDYLCKIFSDAINNENIVALSIGTRPDCLGKDVIELLGELNKIKPVFVELGLQTVHAETAKLINRCYELSDYDEAVRKLKEIGVNVVVHVILGLPHETEEMMLETVDYVVKSGADGIKLHLLHVLKGTALEKMYLDGGFDVLTEDEYIALVIKCLKHIPKNVVVHRVTGDAPKKLLVAPLWSADKKEVLNRLNREIRKK